MKRQHESTNAEALENNDLAALGKGWKARHEMAVYNFAGTSLFASQMFKVSKASGAPCSKA